MHLKKTLKKVFYTTLLISLLVLVKSKLIISAGQLQIEIWSDKTEYLTREPISVHYKVKNTGDKPVVMIFHALKEYFKIRDEKGQEYSNTLSFSYGFVSDSLKPSDTFEGSEGIDRRYGIIHPGEYWCYLQSPKWGNTQPTKSNEIKIKVKDPKGEEKKALNLYLEAEKLKWGRDIDGKKDPIKRELGFLKFQELADKHPNSIYAPLSLYSAIGIYLYSPNLEERRKILSVCRRLIEEYPNSNPFMSAFIELIDTYKILKDKEGAIKIMNELIKKHPDTKISEEAGKRLKQIEKWKF